jgi:hypothetical protein
MILTLDELSIVALYREQNRQQTLKNLYAVPISMVEPDLQELFRSTKSKLHGMTDEEFDALDFQNALLAEDGDEPWQ